MRSPGRFSGGAIVVVACAVVVACMVETPVVDGDDGGDDGGGERVTTLPSWCNDICNGLDECPDEQPEPCLDLCLALFRDFEKKNDTCTDAGERAKRCVNPALCLGFEGGAGCSVSEERESCLDSRGQTSCYSAVRDAAICQVEVSDCANGDEYTLECFPEGDMTRCSCKTNNAIRGQFVAMACPSETEAIETCAWPAIWPPRVPTPPAPVRCELGASTSSGGAQCSMSFVSCTDGHDYSVNCFGVEEGTRCECSIDDDLVNTYSSPDGVCDFALEPDDGRIAVNHACGFSIQPTPEPN